VKKPGLPRRDAVQALSPATVEALRAMLNAPDATLVSVLAYAGLRPGEALGLRWGDVRERTILIQRSISLGGEADTKTRQHRTVRLLAPLAADLRSWRTAAGRPDDDEFVFPGKDGQPLTQAAYQSWRRRAFRRAAQAAGLAHATVRPEAWLRLVAIARRPKRHLRRSPARERRPAHADAVRARDGRARGPPEDRSRGCDRRRATESRTERAGRRVRIWLVTKAELHKLVDELPDSAVEGAGVLLRGIIKGPIDPDQAWFWTPEWQASEREADAEIAAGGGTRYHSDEEFRAALDERSGSSDADV
jgi:hypothetical protein